MTRTDASSSWVAGVDGCRAGWFVVLTDVNRLQPARCLIAPRFTDILALSEDPAIIAVDMPIGLPDVSGRGGRACDVAARSVLGARQSSVFAVPARAAVMETDYAAACQTALRQSDPPRRVSKQCFNLFAKMREVDAEMSPQLQDRVHECHPEAAFWAMYGNQALETPKKVKSRPHEPGLADRRQLLEAQGFDADFLRDTPYPKSQAAADDLLDACACAVTALRILHGKAQRFPADPPCDARGLRMEIWA